MSNDILEQEILKIRQNKILAEYLEKTAQFLQVNIITKEIEFHEDKELLKTHNQNTDDWSVLMKPIIPQHPAQHYNLSE